MRRWLPPAASSEKARRLARKGLVSNLKKVENFDGITLEDIADATRDGDAAVISLLEDAARATWA